MTDSGERPTLEPNPHPIARLLDSARRWTRAALTDWSNDDAAGVAAHAPLAVEHLAKAVLWNVSPALLVTLQSGHEASLVALAGKAPTLGPDLKTVGLSDALARAVRVLDAPPSVSEPDRKRLVSIRNGVMHIGHAPSSLTRNVLSDALQLCNWLLPELDVSQEDFYGTFSGEVDALLTQRRTETEDRVAQLTRQARMNFADLKTMLGEDYAWHAFTVERTAQLEEERDAAHADDYLTVKHKCPACGSVGLLTGSPEVEAEADWDGDSFGTVYTVWMRPESFKCNVCRLRLGGFKFLEAASMPIEPQLIASDELRGFDPGEWMAEEFHYLAGDAEWNEYGADVMNDLEADEPVEPDEPPF